MARFPLRISRPKRTADSRGGSVTEFDSDNARTVWVEAEFQGPGFELTVSAAEDIRIGDMIEAPQNMWLTI